jgi:hypothetical protein
MLNLNSIIRGIKADPGLRNSIPDRQIERGVNASEKLNKVLLDMIDQTNVNDDGRISAGDMKKVSDHIFNSQGTGDAWRTFWDAHGNDNGTVESGFHYVQDDGATLEFQGRNFVDTVADAIYHYGFAVKNGRYVNEDGNSNETTADVAGWLNYFLNGENIIYGSGGNDGLWSGTYSNYFKAARSETFLRAPVQTRWEVARETIGSMADPEMIRPVATKAKTACSARPARTSFGGATGVTRCSVAMATMFWGAGTTAMKWTGARTTTPFTGMTGATA